MIRLIGQFNFDILFENMFRASSSVFASKPHTLTKNGCNELNIGWYFTDYFPSNYLTKSDISKTKTKIILNDLLIFLSGTEIQVKELPECPTESSLMEASLH